MKSSRWGSRPGSSAGQLMAGLFAGGLLCLMAVGCRSDGLPESVLRDLEPADTRTESNEERSERDAGKQLVGVLRGSPEPIVRPLSEWSLQETAADALGRMGDAAVPMLIEKLRFQDRDPRRQAEVRQQAAEVLARIGPDAEPAVPALTEALDDPAPGVRKAAAYALGQIGPAAQSAVPALLRTMIESTPASPAPRPPSLPPSPILPGPLPPGSGSP